MWVFKERSHSWPWTRPPFLWLDNYPSRTVSTPFVVSPPIARTEVTTKSAQPPSNLKEHLLDQEAAEGRSYTFTVRWLQICFSVSRPSPPSSQFLCFVLSLRSKRFHKHNKPSGEPGVEGKAFHDTTEDL